MKQTRVILVRITIGRGTARKHPLNQDQSTNLFSVEQKGNNHGLMIETIPAIKKFNCFYKIVTMPDGSEVTGDIFMGAKNYTEIEDSPYTRKGLESFVREINDRVIKCMKTMQKPTKVIEHHLASLV